MKIDWTWSYGEKQERSNRDKDKVALNKLKDENSESMINAHSVSLNHDENTWDMMTKLNKENHSNREELHFKVSDRQMMQQIGNNPFLDNNYHKDVSNHNIFLIPKNPK